MIKYKRDGTLYDVYPLTRYRKTVGDVTAYDRDARGKAYFLSAVSFPAQTVYNIRRQRFHLLRRYIF